MERKKAARSYDAVFSRHNNTTVTLVQQKPQTRCKQAMCPVWTGKLPNWTVTIVVDTIIVESIIGGSIIKGVILGGSVFKGTVFRGNSIIGGAFIKGTICRDAIVKDAVFGGAFVGDKVIKSIICRGTIIEGIIMLLSEVLMLHCHCKLCCQWHTITEMFENDLLSNGEMPSWGSPIQAYIGVMPINNSPPW